MQWLVDVTASYAHELYERGRRSEAWGVASARVPGDLRRLLGVLENRFELLQERVAYVADLVVAGREPAELRREGLVFAPDEVWFLPTVPRPGKVICVGLNYAAHAEETGRTAAAGRPPAAFAKLSTALVGHDRPVPYPAETRRLDYEAELAIVIGRESRRLDEGAWLDSVAGFTAFNDLTDRDVQRAEKQSGLLLLGKNLDATGALGPYLVTKDEIADPQRLRITLTVNGELRQAASTAEMIHSCAELVAYWSRLTLEPGDVIATGTPAGVAASRESPENYLLRSGDVVVVTIDEIGTLRNRIV